MSAEIKITTPDRRSFLRGAASVAGMTAGFGGLLAAGLCQPPAPREPYSSPSLPDQLPEERFAADAPLSPRDRLRITRLETLLVQPRWLLLKVVTDEGLVGWGEPIVEGRAETCATAVAELSEYLVGKDTVT
jgi:galactonate dehydratase